MYRRREFRPSKGRKPPAKGSTSARRDESCHRKAKAVFVSNIPYTIKEQELLEHFKSSSDPTGCKILRDTDGKSKGRGFVDFSTAEEAVKAFSTFNGSQLKGRKIKVEMKRCPTKPGRKRSEGHGQNQSRQSTCDSCQASPTGCCDVWIGPFSQTTREDTVKAHVSRLFGSCVTAVRLVGKSSGKYGIITFDTPTNAQSACLIIDSSSFFDTSVQVRLATDMPSDLYAGVSKLASPTTPPAPSRGAAVVAAREREMKKEIPKPYHARVKNQTQDRLIGESALDSRRSFMRDCDVWIGPFPLTTTEGDLKAYLLKRFASCATAVRIVHTSSGKFGIVTFGTSADAVVVCLSMDSTIIFGARVQVRLSTSNFDSESDKPVSPSTVPASSEDATPVLPREQRTETGHPKPQGAGSNGRAQDQPRPVPLHSHHNSVRDCCDVRVGSTRVEKPAYFQIPPASSKDTSISPRDQEMKNQQEMKQPLTEIGHVRSNEHAQDLSGQSGLDFRRSPARGCDIWIGPFPHSTEVCLNAYLSKRFASCATGVQIVRKSLGSYGVVSSVTLANAQKAVLGMDGTSFLGTRVQVRLVDKPGSEMDTGNTLAFLSTPPVPSKNATSVPPNQQKTPKEHPESDHARIKEHMQDQSEQSALDQPICPPTTPVQSTPLSPTIQEARKYRHSDPLVTRLLCTKLIKKIKEMAEPLQVKVTPSNECDNLTLFGTPEAVTDVNSRLVSQASEVETSFIESTVTVESVHVTALPLDSLKAQLCHLEKDWRVCIKQSGQCLQKSSVKKTETQHTRSNICKLQIAKGKLSDEDVDAIVCPITADFLPQPGLTEDALKAGGQPLRYEIEKYRHVCGTLKVTSTFDLPAGDLKSRKVILVVMPTKKSFFPWRLVSFLSDYDEELQKSIRNVLSLADRLQIRSLSLPVLGEPGCMSYEDIVSLMTSTLKEHVLKTKDSTLDCVRIATLDDKEMRMFQKTLRLYGTETEQDASTTTHVMIKRGQWMYQDDSGQFMPFDSTSNATLEKKYSDSAANAVISIGSFVYKIDLSKMTQLNQKTGKRRKLQRISMPPSEKPTYNPNTFSKWAYYGHDCKFHYYDDESNSIIDEAWKTQENEAVVAVSGRTYKVDLKSWRQTNMSTLKQRPIKLLSVIVDRKSTGDNLEASKSEFRLEKFVVRGQKEDVEAAVTHLEYILKVERSSKSFSVPVSVYDAFQYEIDNQARRLQVKMKSLSREGSAIKIELEGISNLVDHAIQAIQQVIIANRTNNGIMTRPNEWDPQDDSIRLKMVTLAETSQEYRRVKSRMSKTMPSIRLLRIERVQNLWLWRKYVNHKHSMMEKNKGVVNEKELFHGTRSTDPVRIYDSEDGFDMRFSGNGLYGQGSYFAENSSYSDIFSFSRPSGEKQMFLAKVLTGDSANISPDSSLRMPPVKQSSGGLRYDSVTGISMQSRIYVIYNNDKSYPLYLITYMAMRQNWMWT